MIIIFFGLFAILFIIFKLLPEQINFQNALEIASISGKLEVLDFSFDLENRYTVWSGIIGGTFLMLSYFGTDQSQVQRYLSGKSLREMQLGMIFNGILKVPMQFFILFIGVMVFIFYQFNLSPLNFNPQANKVIVGSSYENEYKNLKNKLNEIHFEKVSKINEIIEDKIENKKIEIIKLEKEEIKIRQKAKLLIEKAGAEKSIKVETNDIDYIFINFILNQLPKGLIGLLIAVILSAAMSSTSSEINALATTTTMDLIKRNYANIGEKKIVYLTKVFTLLWGICAIIIACVAFLADNLIQLVNIIGSIFYGNVLGIFLIALFTKKIRSLSVFTSAIITQIVIIYIWWIDIIPFLWLNILGCFLVTALSAFIELFLSISNFSSSE